MHCIHIISAKKQDNSENTAYYSSNVLVRTLRILIKKSFFKNNVNIGPIITLRPRMAAVRDSGFVC